ncbi:alpha/beta hydrolase [Bdellovibrio bacteriovorus]|uniref:Lysophospholipase n=1 Tax=Bdellovibrio bacteriovorus TaxID=959 RepID=A0A1Z3N5J5_BDEBC|nr:alpha/beta hydrolase [Bdellovibrio bacteriovorus]ASD62738.1 lysophospholipase [Bdellovibrio bacteriovorus]
MYKRSEGFFKGYQDIKLFFQIWDNPEARGTVIITHGHGEHSESYHRLIKAFENDKWSFYGWDLRGHGRSDGRRGYVAEFDDYCKDYKIFLDMVMKDEKVKKGPVILYCHSMGGLIQLKTLLQNSDIDCTAMVISAPLLGLTVPVPAFKAKGAGILNKLLPQITMGNELSNDMLTRDPDVIREYEQDALRHTRVSPGAFLGFLESFEFVNPRANQLKKPALVIVSDADPVISTAAAKALYEHLGTTEKELYVYPGGKHELINDTIRQTVYADIKKFLDGFLESK